MRTPSPIVSLAAAALSAVVLAVPAQAEVYRIDDPADATASLTDITGLEVDHGNANVLVKVRFRELVRSSAAGVSVYLDTDPADKGPEYVLSSGLNDGTDYMLSRAQGWRGSDDQVLCDYSARPKWGQDVFRAVISRACLDDVAEVRVSVRMTDQADGSHPVVDWAPRRHRWTLPVATGRSA